jgi:putative copper export protein
VRRLTLGAVAVLLVSAVAHLLLQGAELLDRPVGRVLASGAVWTLLAGTKSGWSALLQSSLALLLLARPSQKGRVIQAVGVVLIGGVALLAAAFGSLTAVVTSLHTLHLLLIILAAVLYGLLTMARRRRHADWIPALVALGILGGFTMTSHAAGEGGLAIAADWIHVAATGVWIGGLVSLLVTLGGAHRPSRRPLARAIVPRFSALAGGALVALIATGVYSAWVQMPALRAFADTPYGRTLLVKLVIVVPLVALGAVNRFVVTPMLRRAEADHAAPVGAFLRFVGGEVVLAATVLAVVAVLTITPPARVTLPGPAAAQGQHLVGYADAVRVALIVTPARPGWNRFEIRARQADRPIDADARVLIRLTKLDEQLDPVLLRTAREDDGRYVVEAGAMAVPGWWDLDVVLRRAGRPDVATSFPLRLGEAPAPPEEESARILAERARQAAAALRSWRERLQLADGTGGVALTTFAIQAPDRMHYRTPEGTEAIVIGRTRYFRTGLDSWEQDTIAEPFTAQGPLAYLREMRGTSLGRRMPCGDEICRVVLWEWGRTTGFAALIGAQTARVHRIVMVAPGHFMTVDYTDFNGQIRVDAPR